MTSKIIVNNIEADAGVSTVTFNSKVASTEFVGNLTGTASTATAAATAYGLSGSPTLSGISSVSTTNLTVNGNAYPSAGPLSNRNRIINGAMQVAQRGTSSSSNGYVSLDRWYVNQSGGSTTFSQQTFTVGDEIEGIPTYARLTVSSSSDYTTIRQRIEDVKTIPAGTVTVSFWAKGTAPDSGLKVYLVQNFGSGGSADVDISPQDVSLTATWTKHSVNFTIPSISGKTIGSSSFLQVSIGQYSNTATTAWELDITGVQLEVGTVATPFEHRSYGDELARCQRYYKRVLALQGRQNQSFFGSYYGTSTAINIDEVGLYNMRASVNVSLGPTGDTGNVQYYSYGGAWTSSTFSVSTIGLYPYQQLYFYATADGDGRGKLLRRSGASDGDIYVEIDAEL